MKELDRSVLAEALAATAPDSQTVGSVLDVLGLPRATSRAESAPAAVTRWDLLLQEAAAAGAYELAVEVIVRRWGHVRAVADVLGRRRLVRPKPDSEKPDSEEEGGRAMTVTVSVGGNVNAPVQIGGGDVGTNNADVAALVSWALDVRGEVSGGRIEVGAVREQLDAILTEIAAADRDRPDRKRLRSLGRAATRLLESATGEAVGGAILLVAPKIAGMF